MPKGEFRTSWPMLGSWTILDEGEATGQHVVYTQRGGLAKTIRSRCSWE